MLQPLCFYTENYMAITSLNHTTQKFIQLTEQSFLDEFERENGSYICNDLLGCDISTPDGVKEALDKNLFKELCPKMVESATQIAKKIIF